MRRIRLSAGACLLAVLALTGCFEGNEEALDASVIDAAPPVTCEEGATQPCFVDGDCGGTQTCSGGAFGACVPPEERCDGIDNDCDGTSDEGYDGLGDPCEAGEGACLDRGAIVCTEDGAGTICDATPGDETTEVCDGVDNDCDGEIDDDVPTGAACDTGREGACAAGTTACADGDTICEANTEASDETCDGLDNDCDGRVDEDGVGGVLAAPCYEGPEGTDGTGICAAGVSLCVDGIFGACEGQVTPGAEICDGVDNDCDGEADGDQCACIAGESQPCYSGAEGTDGVGACRAGTQTCLEDGSGFGACAGETVPGVELCDGADNDCDGATDEVVGVGEACSAGQGACRADGVRGCDLATGQVVCDAVAGLPADETCDGLDNDCDGIVDDIDGIGEPCEEGAGACLARGVLACDLDSGALACTATAGRPGVESCNAIDDDCDGAIDEVPGVGEPCEVGIGICRSTATTRCDIELGTVVCPATEQPAAPGEVCQNGQDDDCDGTVDEGECTRPCDTDEDCRRGTLCEGNECVPGDCRDDDDCGEDELCIERVARGIPVEPVARFCQPGNCRGDDECQDGQICDAFFCIDRPTVCAEPPDIFEFGTTEGTTVDAPSQVGASCAGGALSPENAYRLVIEHIGTICIDTFGSAYDTALYVRTDCERSGTEIACNDDAAPGFLQSQIELEYDLRNSYYVFVDGFSGGGNPRSGAYTLRVREGACGACASDDDCVPDERCANIANVCVPDDCGDGVRDFGEGCDDGGNEDGDGCSARCTVEDGFACISPDGLPEVELPFDGRVNCGGPAAAALVDVAPWPVYRAFVNEGAIRVTGGARWQTQASIAVNGVEAVRIPFVGEGRTPEEAYALLRGIATPVFEVPEGATVGAYFRDANCGDNAGTMSMRIQPVDLCYSTVCLADEDCSFGQICVDGTCTDPIDSDEDGVDDLRDIDDDNDGIPDAAECFGALDGQLRLINGGFEEPVIPIRQQVPNAAVPGWNTTEGGGNGPIELWNNGIDGVPAAVGNAFAEVNANEADGALYQDIATVPGTRFTWSFYHRGRLGEDTLVLRAGAPGATVALVEATTGNTAWRRYTGSYVVPAGQNLTRFEFRSIRSTGGAGLGNFIDGVEFLPECPEDADEDGDGIPNSLDLDADGDGILDADEAGHDLPHTDGRVDGPVGGNGLVDEAETVPDSGTIDYVIRDTDGDGVPDFLQIGPFACGNGLIDDDEECDDGNREDGDGCSIDCLVEEDYVCAEPVDAVRPCEDDEPFETIAITPGQNLPIIGGNGGGPFDDACGAGQVVIGFDLAVGRWGGFPGVDFITKSQAACASFDVAGGAVVLTPTGLTPVRGITGQINNSIRCPEGHVVTGYVGYDAGGGQRYVAGLALVCSPVSVQGGAVVVGAPIETPPVGNTSNRVGRRDCAAGQLVGANVGRSGDIVDQFTMRCDDIVEGCRERGSVCEFTGECMVDAECEDGDLCRGHDCVTPGMCPDGDDLEPNDTEETAVELAPGLYEGLAVCGNDDFHAIDVCAGGTLTIELYFLHAGGDIDLAVVGGPSSVSTSDDERVTLVNAGPERRVVWRVYGFRGAQNAYAMQVDLDCDNLVPWCGDGSVNGDEACDDGNRESGDGCSDECQPDEDLRCVNNADCEEGLICAGGRCEAPVDTDADGIDDGRDLDDDGDGIPDANECFADLEGQVALINGGFEIPGGFNTVPQAQVPGWSTTAADGFIELWNSGFQGVPSAEGGHFAELNANVQGALYQDISTVPGTTFDIRFFHRGRSRVENMELRIGAPGATVQILTASTGTDAWREYVTRYTVPAGQVLTRFEFASLDPGSVGNFLDGIQFTPRCDEGADADGDGIPNSLDLDSDDDGIPDAEEAGHDLPHTGGVVDGPAGQNGLVDAAETAPGSGIIDYEIRDSDGDGTPDFLQVGPFTCGNGAIDGDEECDDGDRDDGDGCAADCTVEPDWMCSEGEPGLGPCRDDQPVETVTLQPGDFLPITGGEGGAPFDDPCAPGEVVTGFVMSIDSAWGRGQTFVQASRAQCAALAVVDGEVQLTPTGLTPIRGEYNPQQVIDCPQGAVVVGYIGYEAPRDDGAFPFTYASAFGLVCGTPRVVDNRFVVEDLVDTPVFGDQRDFVGRFVCPEGSLVGANAGRSGGIVDQLTVRCDGIEEACQSDGSSVCEFVGECLVDADCADGELCRGEQCVALGMCPDDDGFEPNDAIDAAVGLVAGLYEGLAVCGDDDFHAIDVCAGGTVTVDLYFVDNDGDVDLAQVPEGPSSTSVSDDERIVIVNGDADATVTWRVYGFNGAQNAYAMRVTVDGCEDIVPLCQDGIVPGDCPDGFTATADGRSCERLEQVPAQANGALLNVCRAPTNPAYGPNGARLPGGQLIAGGFIGAGGNDSRLNQVGIWACGPGGAAGADPVGELIGFSTCFDLPAAGDYVIGIAGDNGVRAQIDGAVVFDSPVNDFQVWHLVPRTLTAGTHIITLEGSNAGGPAAFGAEIYGPFPAGSLVDDASMMGLPYAETVVFSTLDEVGRTFQTGTTSGFGCPEGTAFDTCGGGEPVCTAFERLDRCELGAVFCGNGAVDAGEECDDGNDVGGDGCSAECVVEPAFICEEVGFGIGVTDQVGNEAAPDWITSPDGFTVTQRANSRPTTYSTSLPISPNYRATMRLAVNTVNDDDQIGWTIGANDTPLSAPDAPYLLFSWKQGEQNDPVYGLSTVGLRVGLVEGPVTDVQVWQFNGPITRIADGNRFGAVGWEDNRTYTVEIIGDADRLLVYVDGELEFDLEGPLPTGNLGFFTYSQDQYTAELVSPRSIQVCRPIVP